MNFFPMTLASGEAFCNRKQELLRIRYNLEQGNPTLLISPRRYGKTSLALKAFEENNWIYSHIDLYKALSKEDIVYFILNGIGKLLGQISTSAKFIKTATEFFSSFQIKFVLADHGLVVQFDRKQQSPVETLLLALEKLDVYAKKNHKKAVIFLDEFQVLHEISKDISIESAIREAVQKSKNINYIFSGSNRHLIEEMFNDKKRPFYKLCDTIYIERIEKDAYKNYINKAAKKRWSKELPETALTCILELTGRHSYYINKLCSLLWQNVYMPIEKIVEGTWRRYAIENKASIERELSLLSINQRKILIKLAEEGDIAEPFSKRSANQWHMSATSIHKAMQFLLEKDYVYVNSQKKYCILDPLIKTVLQN